MSQTPRPPVPISITICGDGGTGKSSITLRLVRQAWTTDYDPTIEDSYTVTRVLDGVTYTLSLIDTAGQEEYRGMWGSNNLSSDAFLLVYDITSTATLHNLQYFNDMVDMEGDIRLENAQRAMNAGINPADASVSSGTRYVMADEAHAKMVPPVKVVAGNKCDLQSSRQVTAKEGMTWARERHCGFMETSAFLVVNIEETFATIIRRVMEARKLAEQGIFDLTSTEAAIALGRAPAVPRVNLSNGHNGHNTGIQSAQQQNQVSATVGNAQHHQQERGRADEKAFSSSKKSFWRRFRCW